MALDISHQLVTEVSKSHQYVRPLMDKGFIEGEDVRNQPQMIPSSSNSKGKVPEMLLLRDCKTIHPLVKSLF